MHKCADQSLNALEQLIMPWSITIINKQQVVSSASEWKRQQTRTLSTCPCQLWIRRDYCCQSMPPTDEHSHCHHSSRLYESDGFVTMRMSVFLTAFWFLWESVSMNVLSATVLQTVVSLSGEMKPCKRARHQRRPLCCTCVRATEHMEWIGSNVTL